MTARQSLSGDSTPSSAPRIHEQCQQDVLSHGVAKSQARYQVAARQHRSGGSSASNAPSSSREQPKEMLQNGEGARTARQQRGSGSNPSGSAGSAREQGPLAGSHARSPMTARQHREGSSSSNAVSAPFSARERRQSGEEQPPHSLRQAALESHNDAKLMQRKLRELDRGTAPAIPSADGRRHGGTSKEELRLKRERELEEARLATRAVQREKAIFGAIDCSPEKAHGSQERLHAAGQAQPCSNSRGQGSLPSSNESGRHTARTGPSSMSLAGGMVAASGSRPSTSDTCQQAALANPPKPERTLTPEFFAGMNLPLRLNSSPEPLPASQSRGGADLADLGGLGETFMNGLLTDWTTLTPDATLLPLVSVPDAPSQQPVESVNCLASAADQLIELSGRFPSPPPLVQQNLAGSTRDHDCDSRLDFVDDDALSESGDIAKAVAEQASNTLDFSLTARLSLSGMSALSQAAF